MQKEKAKKRENTSIKSETIITFRSHQVINMVRGRKKKPGVEQITGLLVFGGLVRQVFQQSKGDNPYADLYLLTCEEKMDKLRLFLRSETISVEASLMSNKYVTVNEATVEEPYALTAAFATPYAYQVAYLMVQADDLICRLVQASHIAMIPKKEADAKIRSICKRLRSVFASFNSWKSVVVTRSDIELNNQRAKKASEVFGGLVIPAEILSGDLRGEYAPDLTANDEDSLVTEDVEEEAVVI